MSGPGPICPPFSPPPHPLIGATIIWDGPMAEHVAEPAQVSHKATLVYDFGAPEERRKTVSIGEVIPPVIEFEGTVFVLRSYILGFIDNISRQGAEDNLYIQTSIWKDVKIAVADTA
jgi:hypothetical protein